MAEQVAPVLLVLLQCRNIFVACWTSTGRSRRGRGAKLLAGAGWRGRAGGRTGRGGPCRAAAPVLLLLGGLPVCIGAGRKGESPLGPGHLREPSLTSAAPPDGLLFSLPCPPRRPSRRLITSPRPSTLKVPCRGCIPSGAVAACTLCALVLSPLPPLLSALQALRPVLNQTAAPWRPPGSWTTCSRCCTCRRRGRLWQRRRSVLADVCAWQPVLQSFLTLHRLSLTPCCSP